MPIPFRTYLSILIFMVLCSCTKEDNSLINHFEVDLKCPTPPCVSQLKRGGGSIPIPCNCLPLTTVENISDFNITFSSEASDDIRGEIQTVDGGEIFASSSVVYGGDLNYNKETSEATLQFGLVDEALIDENLQLVLTFFVLEPGAGLQEEELVIDITAL